MLGNRGNKDYQGGIKPPLDEGYSIKAFRERLYNLCQNDFAGLESDRASLSKTQAEQASALAGELGLLKSTALAWSDFQRNAEDLHFGSEHAVEYSPLHQRVIKITIPPGFGLVPIVVDHPVINLRSDSPSPEFRRDIEFVCATPLEYLDRWIDANELFGDNVRLASMVAWADGQFSFVLTQPQYHGEPASDRIIDDYFRAAGWTRLPDYSGHTIYYHYPFQTLAIDAFPRNCYASPENDAIYPFDVILCRPGSALCSLLKLYPA